MMLTGHILQKHAKTGGSPVDEGLIVCLLVCGQEKLKGGVEGVAPELMNQVSAICKGIPAQQVPEPPGPVR